MTRKSAAAAVAAALLVAACGGDEDAPAIPTAPYAVDGTSWSYCHVEENFPQDAWTSFTFMGNTLHTTQLEYSSSDGTCSGTAHANPDDAFSLTFTDRGEIDATLAGAPVRARSLHATADGETFVNGVMYVDPAPEPDVLYLGFDEPTVLWPRPHWKESGEWLDVSGVTAPALQGTWISCNTEELQDRGEALTVTGYAISVSGATYTSGDGSCTGTATPSLEDSGVLLLRPTTMPATLGESGVMVRQADVVFGAGGALHSILYVDASATPPVLYTGDEMADPTRDGSTTDRRPIVLQHWRPRIKQ